MFNYESDICIGAKKTSPFFIGVNYVRFSVVNLFDKKTLNSKGLFTRPVFKDPIFVGSEKRFV